MTEKEITKIEVGDVLLNLDNRRMIQITGIEEHYFRYYGQSSYGYYRDGGTIPKSRLASIQWVSLMRDREQVMTPDEIVGLKCKDIQDILLKYYGPKTFITITKDCYSIGGIQEES